MKNELYLFLMKLVSIRSKCLQGGSLNPQVYGCGVRPATGARQGILSCASIWIDTVGPHLQGFPCVSDLYLHYFPHKPC